MHQQYPYYTIYNGEIVIIILIYGTRAIYLLLCDNQYTKYEQQEIDMGIF